VTEKLDYPSTISFDRWRYSIQTSMDYPALMLVLAAYLSGWRSEEAAHVPAGFADPITSVSELMARAVDLSRADAHFNGRAEDYPYLRELSLTVAFAANRMRYLQAIKVRV
jgi:hypothetical protein